MQQHSVYVYLKNMKILMHRPNVEKATRVSSAMHRIGVENVSEAELK